MIKLSILFISAQLFLTTFATANDRPNILVLLLDDAGWTDVGCFGSQIETPNIDRLADQGMRFTDCHSAAPNCSPSRAGLLTGRTPSRVGIYSYLPPQHVMHLRSEEITLAELLKDAGYRTGHFGKWHLSRLESDQPSPADQGFEYSLGTDNNASPSHLNPNNFVRNGKAVGEMKGYSCQIVAEESLAWIRRIRMDTSDDPFFACVWFHEPHTPIASPPELIKKYQSRFPNLSEKEATYHANVENADAAIGKVLAGLQELGIDDDTLIFFTSDNGPLNRFSRVGLRGQKSHVWEGGHRVPGIFRWPGKIKAGSECSVPICSTDFLPTVCEIVDIVAPTDRTLDGTSIMPLLSNNNAGFKRGRPLYWFFYRLNPALAIRDGRWSLIADTNDADREKAHQLLREDMPRIRDSKPVLFQMFDVSEDLGQQNELSDVNPKELRRLKAEMNTMHRDVVNEGFQWDVPADYGEGKTRKIWNSE